MTFFGGNDFGGGGNTKYGGMFSAVMQCDGNVLTVNGFSFFGGNVNVNSKHGGNCGAYLCFVFGARTNGKALFRRLPLYILLNGWFVW